MSAAHPALRRDRRSSPDRRRALALALLAALFALRVVGQLAVTVAAPSFLPPVERWQSGLLPYPVLLAGQGVILALLAAVAIQLWRGTGRLIAPRPRLDRFLTWIGFAYAGSMLVRYALTMALRPEWRWFGHAIPIAFHLVLASALLLYARLLVSPRP
jgi:hypothetical protein